MSAKKLGPSAQGAVTAPLRFTYRWQDVVLYALGVGATPRELPFLYEGLDQRGPRVLPTYAVIPAYEGCRALFDVVGGDFEGVVHGGQSVRLHKPSRRTARSPRSARSRTSATSGAWPR